MDGFLWKNPIEMEDFGVIRPTDFLLMGFQVQVRKTKHCPFQGWSCGILPTSANGRPAQAGTDCMIHQPELVPEMIYSPKTCQKNDE